MNLRRVVRPEMISAHHDAKRPLEAPRWVRQKGGNAGERLFFLGVKDVEDHADQQRVAGLLPVGASLKTAFRIDQDVGDVLDVTNLEPAFAHFKERVVTGARRVGRIEQEAMGELTAPAGCELPVLAFDVVDDGRMRPGQKRRNDKTDAFARARRREAHDMLRPVMPKISVLQPTEEHAGRIEEAGFFDFAPGRPARGAVGRHETVLPCAPERSDDGDDDPEHATRRRNDAGAVEEARRIRLEGVPPLKQPPGQIDGIGTEFEPSRTETRLMPELAGNPLRRKPDGADDDPEDEKDLAYEKFGRCHRSLPVLEPRAQVNAGKRSLRIQLLFNAMTSNSIQQGKQNPIKSKSRQIYRRPSDLLFSGWIAYGLG